MGHFFFSFIDAKNLFFDVINGFRVTNNNVDNMALKNKFMIEPTIRNICVQCTLHSYGWNEK